MKQIYLTLSLLLLITISSFGQKNAWEETNTSQFNRGDIVKKEIPKKFKVFNLNQQEFKSQLGQAPVRFSAESRVRETIISIPTPDGKLKRYKIVNSPVLAPELAAQYPSIDSYTGWGIDDPTSFLKLSISDEKGVSGMIMSPNHSTIYFDPYTGSHDNCLFYYRKDRAETENLSCTTDHGVPSEHERGNGETSNRDADDQILRDYRLAVSTSAEYTTYHGGVAGALAAVNTTMTRVNGVYEKDFAVTMTLIANTTDVFYTNAGSDPYSNNSNSWNGSLETTLSTNIGAANFDIGHLFHTATNSGNAGCIGCVCQGTEKGSAWTSRSVPQGDPFDIDYVAHEIGHQFGGNHTWTHAGSEGTGVQAEPGSGSTIMGYAGITGIGTDVQNNSDDYFHYYTIEQVTTYIKSQTCHAGNTNTTALSNNPPTANAGADFTIPEMTAFILRGAGSDADGDALTYCWEQSDVNPAVTLPNQNNPTGTTNWRSRPPSASPDRYMPQISDVVAGNLVNTWGTVSDVCRNLNFALVVRDNALNGGQTDSDLMRVTVDCSTGPFLVNAPNTAVTWSTGATETVTWDVAGTTAAPVSCANVDILLSTDGGFTYPVTLASNVPNDGTHDITVPNNPGTDNRVMVVCSDNIFFDISNTDFTIILGDPVVSFSSSATNTQNEGTTCGTRDITFDLILSQAPNATTNVTLTTSGTASEGTGANDDYSINNTNFTFTTGNWNTPQAVILTVQEDAIVESDETITISISSVTGSDANGSNSLTFNLIEDDIAPTAGTSNITLIDENFESGFGVLSSNNPNELNTNVASDWQIGGETDAESGSWLLTSTNTSQFAYVNDDDCNCDMSETELNFPVIDLTNPSYTSASLAFDHAFSNVGTNEMAELYVSTDNVNFSILTTFTNTSVSQGGNVYETPWKSENVDLSAYLGQMLYMTIQYNDNGQWTWGMAVDDVKVTAQGTGSNIQTTVNEGTAAAYAEQNLGPNQTVHFYDQTTGNIMCTIENLSAHDYGCTRVEVDRAGTASTQFINSPTSSYLHDKTFKVTPTSNNASGTYNITLYYTAAEVNGWEGATGELTSAAYIHKAPTRIQDETPGVENAAIASMAAPGLAFGSDITYTAMFSTGFSGFGVGIEISPLPVELLSFTGEYLERKGNQLDWTTVTEENTSHFDVERSLDGINFQFIGKVEARGNSAEELDYDFLDTKPANGVNYYRLRMVDLDQTFEYSNVISLKSITGLDISMSPNPTRKNISLVFNQEIQGNVQIQVIDVAGRTVINQEVMPNGAYEVNLNELANGTYFIRVTNGNLTFEDKILKF